MTMRALSIKQPWSWLIVQGIKTIENRDWPTKFRGRFLIHAGKKLDEDGVHFSFDLLCSIGLLANADKMRRSHELNRGGIVGEAEIVDCVDHSDSPWFFGKFGFVIVNAKPLPFRPCKGKLGFVVPMPTLP